MPIYMEQEAYLYGKRGLFIWKKRPIHMEKEAYLYGKRGLLAYACLRYAKSQQASFAH